jgi:hypothetical protein
MILTSRLREVDQERVVAVKMDFLLAAIQNQSPQVAAILQGLVASGVLPMTPYSAGHPANKR